MANITLTLYWDLDLRIWTTTLGGTTEQGPIAGLVQGDTVLFNVRFVQSGAAVTLTAPVFTASGIKAQNDFTGSYLVQLSAPTGAAPLYTFTVSPLNSAQLNTFLQTYRNTWCALEIYDSANGILTTPLELQITPGYSLSGTPTTNVAGVVSVAAGKTVTFPLSLTFPIDAGTDNYQLTTDGAGTLTWEEGNGNVVGPASATDNAIVRFNLATGKLVQNSGVTISDAGAIDTTGADAYIFTNGANAHIVTVSNSAYIQTGSSFKLKNATNNTTTITHASTGDNTIALPDAAGTVALTNSTLTGTWNGTVVAGQYGGTGVANTGKTITLGASMTTTGTDLPTFAFPSAATARTYTFPTTTATLARTDASQTFTGTQTFANGHRLTLFTSGTTTAQPTLYGFDAGGGQGGMVFGSFQADGTTGNYGGINNTPALMNCYAAALTCSYVIFQTGGGLKDSAGNVALTVTATQAVAIPGTLAVTGATTLTGTVTASGKLASTFTAPTALVTGNTTFAVTSSSATITGTNAVTIGTITGGVNGMILYLLFVDANVTITDTAAATTDTVNLSAAFTSAANTTLTLIHNGTKWYEIARSVNG